MPYAQGIAAFTALQRRGIPSRLLIFPNENHWVLKPANSVQWHREVEKWLGSMDSEGAQDAPPMTPRLARPRIAPLPESEWTAQQREEITRGNPPRILNIFRTLIRHPDLYRRWMPFGNHVLFKSSLTPRDREIAILRVGWLCRSAYEFHQHTRVGQNGRTERCGHRAVKEGPQDAGWTARRRALLQAVDELHADSFVTRCDLAGARAHYSEQQLMDLVFAVGQYTMVSMALNTFGVQIEA